ncbi:unnamed protein product [Blepharisma stoltei]|uniref:Uncharacterized protein n=1 Tax=Blepharisma stoltei TaxID=1481888 RepID=A0AAU9II87_9CILI|nr:unnamed protein product [Blepharisma stoltei]
MGCYQSKESEPSTQYPEVIQRSCQQKNIKDIFKYPQAPKDRQQIYQGQSISTNNQNHEKFPLESKSSDVSSKRENHRESDEFYKVCKKFSIKRLDDFAFPDKRFDLILDSLTTLSENHEWSQIVSEPNLKIEQKPTSMLKERIVMKCKIIFDQKISLAKIVEALHEPELIKKCDVSIDDITLMTGKTYEDSVVMVTRTLKGKERKFIDRWSTRTNNGVIISIVMADKEVPDLEEYGQTVFQTINIEEINAGTKVTIIQQLDVKMQGKIVEGQISENFKNSVFKLREYVSE